jgi:extradiol dioxygenase family protein
MLAPFHIAFPVDDFDAGRFFVAPQLSCPGGRSSSQWINLNLFGHQMFFLDHAGDALEFRAFADVGQLFAMG